MVPIVPEILYILCLNKRTNKLPLYYISTNNIIKAFISVAIKYIVYSAISSALISKYNYRKFSLFVQFSLYIIYTNIVKRMNNHLILYFFTVFKCNLIKIVLSYNIFHLYAFMFINFSITFKIYYTYFNKIVSVLLKIARFFATTKTHLLLLHSHYLPS